MLKGIQMLGVTHQDFVLNEYSRSYLITQQLSLNTIVQLQLDNANICQYATNSSQMRQCRFSPPGIPRGCHEISTSAGFFNFDWMRSRFQVQTRTISRSRMKVAPSCSNVRMTQRFLDQMNWSAAIHRMTCMSMTQPMR